MKQITYISLILILGISCQKFKDCIGRAGEKVILEYELQQFDTIIVNDDFLVHLIQDSANFIQISGYESFVNSTKFSTENNILSLSNDHKCKFSKPRSNHTEIFIHVDQISRIRLNSASGLVSDNELTNDDEIGLIINSKYNEADLKLNCHTFYYWNKHLNGGKIILNGNTNVLKLWNTSLGSINAMGLNALKVLIDTDSRADITVNALNELDCTVRGHGNVYCYGSPTHVIKNDSTSTGRLIFVK